MKKTTFLSDTQKLRILNNQSAILKELERLEDIIKTHELCFYHINSTIKTAFNNKNNNPSI